MAAAVQDASQWLSVLLEILLKLCDIRESDLSLEPEVNRITSAPDVRKKKGNGLRRLKGPDVGTEEWGNLSDDLGGGSDSSAESEYSSSDESEEGAWNLCLVRPPVIIIHNSLHPLIIVFVLDLISLVPLSYCAFHFFTALMTFIRRHPYPP